LSTRQTEWCATIDLHTAEIWTNEQLQGKQHDYQVSKKLSYAKNVYQFC